MLKENNPNILAAKITGKLNKQKMMLKIANMRLYLIIYGSLRIRSLINWQQKITKSEKGKIKSEISWKELLNIPPKQQNTTSIIITIRQTVVHSSRQSINVFLSINEQNHYQDKYLAFVYYSSTPPSLGVRNWNVVLPSLLVIRKSVSAIMSMPMRMS